MYKEIIPLEGSVMSIDDSLLDVSMEVTVQTIYESKKEINCNVMLYILNAPLPPLAPTYKVPLMSAFLLNVSCSLLP